MNILSKLRRAVVPGVRPSRPLVGVHWLVVHDGPNRAERRARQRQANARRRRELRAVARTQRAYLRQRGARVTL